MSTATPTTASAKVPRRPADTSRTRRPSRPRLHFERRIWRLAFLAGLPGTALGLGLLWTGSYSAQTQWTATAVVVLIWLGCAWAVRERVRFPLQTLANLIAAVREGDYSIRARASGGHDALAEVMREVNALSADLREQRLGAHETGALLRQVMAEIDVAVFAFDPEQRLRLVNQAGERLLMQGAEQVLGRRAAELGLASGLEGEPTRAVQINFAGRSARWAVRRGTYREGGRPHQLLMLTDLSRTLREEERDAWQRLVRVIGHELNNSLAPIKSIAGSLESLLTRNQKPADWQEDLRRGLAVIRGRADGLSRFMEAYSRLARLPPPRLQPVVLSDLVRRVIGLETRMAVAIVGGPALTLSGDVDQLEQLLINLVRNAVDAARETGGEVTVAWTRATHHVELRIEDEGPGLATTANLFVPFYTTKPGGTGIGLALSRQIAEAHGGTLTLEHRAKGSGCVVRLTLPL